MIRKKMYIIISTLFIFTLNSCNKTKDKSHIDKGFKYFYIDVKGFDQDSKSCLYDAFLGKKVSCSDIFQGEYLNMATPPFAPLDSIKFLDARTLPESNFVDNLYKMIITDNKSDNKIIVEIFISEASGRWRRIRYSSCPIDYSIDSNELCKEVKRSAISHMTL